MIGAPIKMTLPVRASPKVRARLGMTLGDWRNCAARAVRRLTDRTSPVPVHPLLKYSFSPSAGIAYPHRVVFGSYHRRTFRRAQRPMIKQVGLGTANVEEAWTGEGDGCLHVRLKNPLPYFSQGGRGRRLEIRGSRPQVVGKAGSGCDAQNQGSYNSPGKKDSSIACEPVERGPATGARKMLFLMWRDLVGVSSGAKLGGRSSTIAARTSADGGALWSGVRTSISTPEGDSASAIWGT